MAKNGVEEMSDYSEDSKSVNDDDSLESEEVKKERKNHRV